MLPTRFIGGSILHVMLAALSLSLDQVEATQSHNKEKPGHPKDASRPSAGRFLHLHPSLQSRQIHPEMTLRGWQDVKIQTPTNIPNFAEK